MPRRERGHIDYSALESMYCQRFVLTYLQHDTEAESSQLATLGAPFGIRGRGWDYRPGVASSPVTYWARPKPNDQSPAVFST